MRIVKYRCIGTRPQRELGVNTKAYLNRRGIIEIYYPEEKVRRIAERFNYPLNYSTLYEYYVVATPLFIVGSPEHAAFLDCLEKEEIRPLVSMEREVSDDYVIEEGPTGI